MGAGTLFGELPEARKASGPEASPGEPRVSRAVRDQVALRVVDLEGLLPGDHVARVVWAWVESQDLSRLYAAIKARGSEPGRPPIDPKILLALWLYATIEGVGSARAVARATERDVVYQWLCGGVGVNYHALADFRVEQEEFLDRLLSVSVAALVAEGLVELERLAVDGVRFRASAGQASFRRRARLEQLEQAAAERVAALKREVHDDPGALSKRQRAAAERGARERQERIAAAKQRMEELEAERARRQEVAKRKVGKQKEPRASTSDPEARVMKMSDGGFRPAYNGQVVSDPESGIIVGVGIDTTGSDKGLLRPAAEQVERRYGKPPSELLADGGFVTVEDIEWAHGDEQALTVYAPLLTNKHGTDPTLPREKDGPGMAALRRRMAGQEGKAIYKERCQAELANARLRRQGLLQVCVRGVRKVLTLMLWQALANNILRAASLTGATA